MGRVRAPHGIKGWVKIQPFTQDTEGLLDYAAWWLGRNGQWESRPVAEASVHGAAVIARFEGCESREAAESLKGVEVGIPRGDLPATGANEYYWGDLVGAQVVNRGGEVLGEVDSLLETGANPVLVLKGERERLIPFIAAVIVEVDIAGKRLVVDWERDY